MPDEDSAEERDAAPVGPATQATPADTPAAGAGTGGHALADLLRVQDLDTALAQLRHRRSVLPERLQLDDATKQSAALAAEAARVGAERDEVVGRLTALQGQVDALEARRAAIESRMYASRGTAARDLQAMDEEVQHLRARRAQLEDEELEAMVEQEPLDAQWADITAARDRLQAESARLQEALTEAESVIDAELGEVSGRRASLATGLPEELAAGYEQLRIRLSGIGAARLVGNRCEGCHLELPSVEIDRIRHLPADEVVTCEHCGRILVRVGSPGSTSTPGSIGTPGSPGTSGSAG